MKEAYITYPFIGRQGTVITNDIIDRDTDRKGNSAIHDLSIDLLGKELCGLSRNDSPSEFTNVNDGRSRKTLRDYSLQSEIDNLASLLVLGADIAVVDVGGGGGGGGKVCV
jgi:hypothetical protein